MPSTPTKSAGRRSTRTRAAKEETPVTETESVTENTNESTEENTVQVESANPADESADTEGNDSEATETPRRGRKPMDEAERQRRATFRACESARKLLEENGFTVAAPDNWEDPDAERKREAAKRALEAMKAAGLDPSTLLNDYTS